MTRHGHTRPTGTVWRNVRYRDCRDEPKLEAIIVEIPETLERAFRIIGVAETTKPDVWILDLERITWEDAVAAIAAGAELRGFERDRRPRR